MNKTRFKGETMNRFNERFAVLIYYLYQENDWCSLNYLSKKMNYSKSTLFRELTFLNLILPAGWKIQKNDIKGFRLIKPDNKNTLESVLAQLKESNTYIQILGLIVLNNGVSITDIIYEVHLSRSSVYRQIKKIKEVAESVGVEITNSPFMLKGDEEKIRRFIIQYLEFSGKNINSPNVNPLEINEFKNTLFQFTAECNISLHIGAIHRLATIVEVSNLRISYGCYVSFPKRIIDQYKKSNFFEVSQKMSHFMQKCPSRKIQQEEILLFALYLMNEKKPLSRSNDIFYIRNKLRLQSDIKSKQLFQFFHQLSEYLGFDLSLDDNFLYPVVQAFRRTYIDMEFNTDTRVHSMLPFLPYLESNPLFKTLEKIFMNIFLEFEYTPTPIEKVDVIKFFLLVQAALLRNKKQMIIVTALICRTYIEKEFIQEVLFYHFGGQLRIKVLDLTDIENLKKDNEFDLVISTIDTEFFLDHLPVLKISALPSPAELSEIKIFIDQFYFQHWKIDPVILHPLIE